MDFQETGVLGKSLIIFFTKYFVLSLPLDILTTKYIKLMTKNQFLLWLYFISSNSFVQIISKKAKAKDKNNKFIFIEKSEKKNAEKEKSAGLVFRH